MHRDRGIVRTYIRSDGIITRPDYQNIITCRCTYTNDGPRGLLHSPVTWNPARTRPYSTLRLHLRPHSVTITASTAPLRQDPAHICIRHPTQAPSTALSVPCWQPFPTGFDSPVFRFDLTQLFSDLIRLTCF